jgi:multidrug efflux pump subunit AcrB
MWIVRLALRRPYTFTVMAALIFLLGILSYFRMAKDIFPSVDIPVVCVVWNYGGLAPEELEKRMTTISERVMTTTVNDIEHIESQSYPGIGVIKVFLQENANVESAIAQITASNQAAVRSMPPGTTPPLVIRFSASNVPILQIGLGSKTLPEQTLFDLGSNFVRVPLATVQGASMPLPSGGKSREIVVDIDLHALEAKGLTPIDVSNAITAQNLTLPSGTAKIGDREYYFTLNSSPATVAEFGDLPIKVINGATVSIRDVAQVRDGFAPQTSIVRQDGTRGALLSVLKSGRASTLDVIERIKAALPRIKTTLPPELSIEPRFDQSIFVRASLSGVIREGLIAAFLTAAMILLFLGTWRNTLVVAISIPLSIFCSVICLYALGQTINAMTLGGLALAVGILVDDATVEVENITRNLTMGEKKPLVKAILDGAQQIAVPAFVSTLCICIVFVPIFFLQGTAKFLFGPLAMSVIFAMLASYFLSRTVVPTFVHFLLRGKEVRHDDGSGKVPPGSDVFWRVHVKFNRYFEKLRAWHKDHLIWCLDHRGWVILGMVALTVLTACVVPFLGRDFFPLVDAGQFRLHVRVPSGTRVEETERYFTKVENIIRAVIPAKELDTIIDNIGLPTSGINLAFSDTATIGPSDGEILVQLQEKKHHPTQGYVRQLRARLNRELPECTFFTQPSDIVSQILNFGLPAPIDVQIAGRAPLQNYALAQQLAAEIAKIPGAVDVNVHQILNEPSFKIDVDRVRAAQLGLTQSAIASNLLITLAGSGQAASNYWIDPKNGVQYLVATQAPQSKIDSLDEVGQIPIGAGNREGVGQILGGVATISRGTTQAIVSHYDVQPVFDIYANVDGRDLGSVYDAVKKLVPAFEKKLPRGSFITIRGQAKSMNESFLGLGVGLVFAIFLVYSLMVINFQSWMDPFIIIMALPGALCGIVWALLITQTTISVPALMGAIMSVGVATSNSILLVTFANDERLEGKDAREAAISAGHTRLRPVIMTALAMIIGMAPMALGFGEGGEQNAPLGRAVIGGLLVATIATVIFVPVIYAWLRQKTPHNPDQELEEEMHEGEPHDAPKKA